MDCIVVKYLDDIWAARHVMRMALTVHRGCRNISLKPCSSIKSFFQPSISLCRASTSTKKKSAVDGYYDDLVKSPEKAPPTRTTSNPPPSDSLPKTDKEEHIEKARVVFGSRLAGPIERRRELEKASSNIAGILVPPRPTEPDNCCMSGCVNCVWDRYRDELEEWAEKSAEARQILQTQRSNEQQARGPDSAAPPSDMPSHVASSMDDDGGGSEALWTGNEKGQEKDLFEGVPVGMREFMRIEKKLKQKKTIRDRATLEWEEHQKRLNAL